MLPPQRPNRTPSRTRRRSLAVAVATLLLLGTSVGAIASDEPEFPGIDSAELQAVIEGLPEAATNDDVGRMRSLMGSPDTFDISFEPSDDGSVHRRETWVYYDLGAAFEFVDGALVWDGPLDDEAPFLIHPMRYDPAAFTAESTWESLAPVVGDAEVFEEVALDDEYGVPATIRVGNLLLLAFDETGRLAYVESVALEPEGTP
jgi:hypothetical protein